VKQFNYKPFFPHPEIRDQQAQAIEFALDAFINKNKKFVVIQAGTGVGKSAVGIAVARYISAHCSDEPDYAEGACYVTTQKILQDQYMRDFSPPSGRMCSIKSSSNYSCHFMKGKTCKDAQQMLRTVEKESPFFKACSFKCGYKERKREFLESPESVTNFPYLMTEAAYSGKIVPRQVLVVDEAHNVESELSKFVEVIVSERFATQNLKLKWPRKTTQYQVYRWIKDVYYPKAKSQLKHFEDMLKQVGIKDRLGDFTTIAKQHDLLSSHVEKMQMFLAVYNSDNWVMENVKAFGRAKRKFSFRAIDIAPFARKYLFRLGNRTLLMSATILDITTFSRSLGITDADVGYLSIPSPFPVENRPIHVFPIGRMSAKEIDVTLPKMVKAVREILNQHKGEKGIIHCHTYKVANFIKSRIKSNRLLIHKSDNRDEILQKHINAKTPTVLISPSMAEGVDLKDDLSRFQIILKIPYPYLGDPLVRKRMNRWSDWYSLQTAKSILQSIGRSVRSQSDEAVTYILDADWSRFYSKNSNMFPRDFKKALRR